MIALVFNCLASDCQARCSLLPAQVEAIDALATWTPEEATCVPLGGWVFFRLPDEMHKGLAAACPTHVLTMPPAEAVIPVMHGGAA